MIEDLTVLQLKDKRIALENLIRESIFDFERDTGCFVESVNTQCQRTFNRSLYETINVIITVKV
jgi:hypothetical protein